MRPTNQNCRNFFNDWFYFKNNNISEEELFHNEDFSLELLQRKGRNSRSLQRKEYKELLQRENHKTMFETIITKAFELFYHEMLQEEDYKTKFQTVLTISLELFYNVYYDE